MASLPLVQCISWHARGGCMSRPFTRRGVLRAAGLLGAGPLGVEARTNSAERKDVVLRLRQEAALAEYRKPIAPQVSNGDETAFPRWIAAFGKGLPHDQNGEVEPGVYETLLHALATGRHADFENISRGSGRKLANPQAAFASHLEGGRTQP